MGVKYCCEFRFEKNGGLLMEHGKRNQCVFLNGIRTQTNFVDNKQYFVEYLTSKFLGKNKLNFSY